MKRNESVKLAPKKSAAAKANLKNNHNREHTREHMREGQPVFGSASPSVSASSFMESLGSTSRGRISARARSSTAFISARFSTFKESMEQSVRESWRDNGPMVEAKVLSLIHI